MNPLVKKLEEKLLPEFEKIAEQINRTIPNVKASIYANAVGSLTQYQGYDFGIECLLEDALDSEPDYVVLDVSLGYLTTTPRICADVGRDASFRDWSGRFPDEGIVVSDDVLEDLYKYLPKLYEALFKALKRRKPGDE